MAHLLIDLEADDDLRAKLEVELLRGAEASKSPDHPPASEHR